MFNGRTPTWNSDFSQQEQLTIARHRHDPHPGRLLTAIGLFVAALSTPPSFAFASMPTRPFEACEDSAARRIDITYARWVRLLDIGGEIDDHEFAKQAEALVREIFSLDGMSSRILGGRWEDLDEGAEDREPT